MYFKHHGDSEGQRNRRCSWRHAHRHPDPPARGQRIPLASFETEAIRQQRYGIFKWVTSKNLSSSMLWWEGKTAWAPVTLLVFSGLQPVVYEDLQTLPTKLKIDNKEIKATRYSGQKLCLRHTEQIIHWVAFVILFLQGDSCGLQRGCSPKPRLLAHVCWGRPADTAGPLYCPRALTWKKNIMETRLKIANKNKGCWSLRSYCL